MLRERRRGGVTFRSDQDGRHRYFLQRRRSVRRTDYMKTSVFARVFCEPFRSILFDVLDRPQFPVHIVAWHQYIPVA